MGGDVVVRGKECGILLAENFGNLALRPHIELSLLALGIGVERGAEGTRRSGHLTGEPGHGLLRANEEKRVSRVLMGECEKLEDERVVVEHLLEMRDQPALVHRIA